jgi:hypothetical protein
MWENHLSGLYLCLLRQPSIWGYLGGGGYELEEKKGQEKDRQRERRLNERRPLLLDEQGNVWVKIFEDDGEKSVGSSRPNWLFTLEHSGVNISSQFSTSSSSVPIKFNNQYVLLNAKASQ